MARLLNIYQLWLDDLYPRAKFADGLEMIEKIGHKKQLQVMRKEWINEGKPKDNFDDLELAPQAMEDHQNPSATIQHPALVDNAVGRRQTLAVDNRTEDELLGPHVTSEEVQRKKFGDISEDSLFISDAESEDNGPPEDDLDALLAEDEINTQARSYAPQVHDNHDGGKGINFDDEMEAMAEMDNMW